MDRTAQPIAKPPRDDARRRDLLPPPFNLLIVGAVGWFFGSAVAESMGADPIGGGILGMLGLAGIAFSLGVR